MQSASYRLESAWQPDGGPHGRFTFSLFNLSTRPIEDFTIVYTSLTRVIDQKACENASFVKRDANYHEFAPPTGFVLAPGASWTFSVSGLHRKAVHCTDGAKSAYLTLGDGSHVTVAVSDLLLEGRVSEPPPVLLPEGKLDLPFALQPWPRRIDAEAGEGFPVCLYPAAAASLEDLRAVDTVLALFRRLFEADHVPFSLTPNSQGRALHLERDAALAPDGYELSFAPNDVSLRFGGAAGRQYGLTTLAQLLNGARREPAKFRFPIRGTISDAPRYSWRGCHLDVSRQFYPRQRSLAADRYPRLAEAQHLPLAPDRRRGMAAGDQGLSAAHHGRRPSRPGRTASATTRQRRRACGRLLQPGRSPQAGCAMRQH